MSSTPDAGRPVGARLGRVLRAGAWSLSGGLGAYALRIGTSLVMTRLLVPDMFGVMALVSVIQVIVALLSDIGLSQAIIQSPRGTKPDFLNTAWTLQVIRGFVIWGIIILISLGLYMSQTRGWISGDTVYAADGLPLILIVATLSSVIGGFRSTKWIIANRQLQMRAPTIIEISAQFIGVIVMIGLGLYTRSIWALVAGSLVDALANVILTSIVIPGQKNRFRWHRESVTEIINFGRWVLISSTLSVMSANGDRLMLGAWVSPASLGFYVLAMNLNNILVTLTGRLFSSIGMPALSEVLRDDPSRFPQAYKRMRVPFDIACLTGAGLLFSFGQSLVDILYDPRYAQAGELVGILSFLLIFSRYGISTSAYLALGRPKYLTVVHFVKLVSIYSLIPLGYHLYGLEGAVWAIALHPLPTVPIIYWFNSRHKLNGFLYDLGVTIFWPVGYLIGLALAALSEYALSML